MTTSQRKTVDLNSVGQTIAMKSKRMSTEDLLPQATNQYSIGVRNHSLANNNVRASVDSSTHYDINRNVSLIPNYSTT
jgi:hypothetical protein